MGRENQQACLYTAFKRKSYSLSGVLEFQWKQQATLASLCRDWPNIVWTCLWPITENETFLWIHGMFEQMKFCGDFKISILMGITCDEGPLCIPDLRQIYLYWQWPFGTPEKNCWYVASCYHWCHVNRQAMGGNLCWFSSWLSYKSGRREYSFFYSAGPILPTELLCILLCRFWWVVVNLWVRGLDFAVYDLFPWWFCDLHVLSIWVEASPWPQGPELV